MGPRSLATSRVHYHSSEPMGNKGDARFTVFEHLTQAGQDKRFCLEDVHLRAPPGLLSLNKH